MDNVVGGKCLLCEFGRREAVLHEAFARRGIALHHHDVEQRLWIVEIADIKERTWERAAAKRNDEAFVLLQRYKLLPHSRHFRGVAGIAGLGYPEILIVLASDSNRLKISDIS